MKNSNNKRSRICLLTVLTVAIAVSIFSCSGIYDNIEKFGADEIIYVERLDGIMRMQIGYERVEIDLLAAGRIPSSRIKTHKAKKTVIECADFDEPGNRRVIDSVCSWVNITGLTQLKTYSITIYTEDEHGNRSLPLEVDVVPYTKENLEALGLVTPSIIESTSAAVVEWKDRISAVTHTVFRYAYSYVDRDGVVHQGGEDGDMPSFLVENVEKGKDIPVTMTCRIVPRIMNSGIYSAILDSIDWQTTVTLRISENAEPAIFLKTPAAVINVELSRIEADFPVLFSWVKVPEASEYALKISDDPDFPGASTRTVNVGDASDYLMDETEGLTLINSFPKVRQLNLYWTVVPITQSAPVKNQVRRIAVARQPIMVGRWSFDNQTNLTEATTGQNLIPVGSGFTSIEGPSPTNRAVRVAKGSYYKCMHGLPTGTDVYTIMIHIRRLTASATIQHGLIQMNPNNTDNAELRWTYNLAPGIDGIGNPTNQYCLAYNAWHQLVMTVNGDGKRLYIDGELAYNGASSDTRFLLNHDGVLFFTDATDIWDSAIDVAEIAIWDMNLTEEEVHKASGLQKLNKAGWTIPYYSDGTNINNLTDGNVGSGWNITTEPPHYAVIDLGAQRNIGRVCFYGPNAAAQSPRTIRLLVSNNPGLGAGWTQVGEIVREIQAPNGGGGNLHSYNFPETSVTGRYIQLLLPDRWGTVLQLNEVSVYEKVSD